MKKWGEENLVGFWLYPEFCYVAIETLKASTLKSFL